MTQVITILNNYVHEQAISNIIYDMKLELEVYDITISEFQHLLYFIFVCNGEVDKSEKQDIKKEYDVEKLESIIGDIRNNYNIKIKIKHEDYYISNIECPKQLYKYAYSKKAPAAYYNVGKKTCTYIEQFEFSWNSINKMLTRHIKRSNHHENYFKLNAIGISEEYGKLYIKLKQKLFS